MFYSFIMKLYFWVIYNPKLFPVLYKITRNLTCIPDLLFFLHFYPVLQYDELEGLGFVGFALAFFEEKSQIVGTSSTLKCFTPEFVEYLHAVIIAGWFVCL